MSDREVLVAEFAHESNTFVSGTTGHGDFRDGHELFGDEVLEELSGTNHEIAGFVDVLERTAWDPLPAFAASATPGGVVDRGVFEYYWDCLERTVEDRGGNVGGVALALHGAMVLEDHDDGDGLVISRVRELLGDDVPIVVTLDLHTNVTPAMIDAADALVAYEEYPHTDMFETGEAAATLLLERLEEGTTFRTQVERPPLFVPGAGQNTGEDPMAAIMGRARRLEDRPDVRKVNVTPGFFRTDIPDAGFAVTAVATSKAAAREVSREVAADIWNRHESFLVEYPDPSTAVGHARERVREAGPTAGPVVLGDTGDNPGGGATGDETALLRELLAQEVEGAGVALIHDPEVVERCVAAGEGAAVTVDLGGKKTDSHTTPLVDLEAIVTTIADGTYRNTGPMLTGTEVHAGRTVLLRCAHDVAVVVTETRIQPFDAEIWRHVGVDPERLPVVVVKSSNHYRADYERFASEIVPVDSPGVNTVDPTDYEYRNLSGPRAPLTEVDAYPDWER